MEKQITIERVYLELKKLEEALKKKGIITEPINIPETALLSEKSLAKDWLSPEDEEAWKDLKFVGDENLLAESWLSKEDEKAFAYLQ